MLPYPQSTNLFVRRVALVPSERENRWQWSTVGWSAVAGRGGEGGWGEEAWRPYVRGARAESGGDEKGTTI